MKLSIILLTVSFIQVFATSGYSQKARISLDLKNTMIKDVLANIESQSGFYFLYSPKMINDRKLVNIKIDNERIDHVLNKLFANSNAAYLIMDKQIVISDKAQISPFAKSLKNVVSITGKVTDSDGNALPGVSIQEVGTNNGTITDLNGNYTISVSDKDAVLKFSFIGYVPQSIAVGDQSAIDITLEEDTKNINEVVVVGYGTQKKANLTGSVSAVSGDDLIKKTVPDVRQALQGEASGVTIIDRGNVPGQEAMEITIRGVSSISAGTGPLVLVDGIEMPIKDVHPSEIESISVLKDAASCAIYGAKAANGVIIITTKRGQAGGFSVNYDGYYGIQTPASLPELVGAYDYLTLVNEALVNAGQSPKYSDEYIQNTVSGTDPINYPYVNLFKELYNPAPVWNHSLNIRGGNDIARVAFSMNHLDQEGMLENVNSTRTGFRLNTDFNISKKLSLKTDISYNVRNNINPNRLSSALGDMIGTSPVTVMKYPNGVYGLSKDNSSALAGLEVGGSNTASDVQLNIKTGFDYQIFDGFHLTGDISYKDFTNTYKNYTAKYDFGAPNNPENIIARWSPSKLLEGRWMSKELNTRLLIDYTKSIGDHNFHFLGGIDVTDSKSSLIEGTRTNIYSDQLTELNTGDVEGQTNRGYSEGWGLESYLGRLNYSFKDRYLFEANFRYDGSSRFAEGHKWGFFPSFSGGWVISKESFMQSLKFLSTLKLRASWGQLGNQNIGLYRFTSTIYPDFPYNFNDVEATGYSQWYYANTDITWETSEMTDFGIDMAFFNNKIEIVADWYQKLTRDVLLILPISPLTGLAASETNAGMVKNTGWEIGITYKNKINSFFYKIGVNLSDVQNELADFAGKEPSISGWTILKEGEPLYALYGYESDGLFQTQKEIDNHAVQPNQSVLKPGDIKLVDRNEDGLINDEDRCVIGSTIPRYTFGVNISLEYKGIDFSAVLQGVLKAENYFYGEANEGVNYEVFATPRVLDRWTPENPNASYPRLEAATNKNNYLYNDFWIRDASYMRLKNLQIGYSLPANILQKVKVNKTRVYVGVTNLFTITNVDAGIDPETYQGRMYYYPPVRTLTFGLNIGL